MSIHYGEGQLFTAEGERKYLTNHEAKALLRAARKADTRERLFCQLLYYTGCRCSEGLQITPRRLDADTVRIVFRTLKRRRTIYRAVPVPRRFLTELQDFAQKEGLRPDDRLFPWCRQTAWRHIRALMARAGINGPQATPKGLRHGFGCHGIGSGLPESLVGRLLGHAESGKSTRIYTHVMNAEERALMARMW